ncbi:MAG TPA: hypothetical protein VN838_30320 [Bradyrhizobium sp.]|nr:hypothetical protein [Bradyrhizobium sp.]
MRRILIFVALFPPIATLVFISPDVVTKGIPASDDLLAWLIASYPIAIIPALLMAGVDRALAEQPLRLLKTTAAGGLMSTLVALFLWSGYAELWPLVMVFLVGALPSAVCSWVSDKSMRSVNV